MAPHRLDIPAPALPKRPPHAEPLAADPGSLRFAADALPWQRSLRWAAPLRDRRLLALGGLLALLVTLLEVVGFAVGMKPLRLAPPQDRTIQVVLIEPEPPPPPAPPEPEPPEILRRASRIRVDTPKVRTTPPPPRADASSQGNARIGSAGVAPPQLFNADGSIRLGGNGTLAAPPPPRNPQEAARARWAEIEKRGNPLDCRKTRFAGAFDADQSAGDKVASKYLKWIGLADPEAIGRRRQQRADSGGCEPAG